MMACDVARGEGEVGVKGERGGAAGGRARLEGLVCGPIPRAPASWRVNWLWHGPGHLHHPGFTVARRQRPTRRRRPVTPTVEPTRSPAAAAGRCSQPWTWWVLGIGTGATGGGFQGRVSAGGSRGPRSGLCITKPPKRPTRDKNNAGAGHKIRLRLVFAASFASASDSMQAPALLSQPALC